MPRVELGELEPDGIAITHAHPDHAFGLRDGTARSSGRLKYP
jgi:glyoxylase-like metal-dependent hydrolase (beta-lactamase superfamily II)